MKIAKYWARESAEVEDVKGCKYHLISWSGSNQSVVAAKNKALEKLGRWQAQLKAGQFLGDYHYADKDEIKEELIQELHDAEGKLIAAITRNRYGALVLNSAQVLFADVDLPIAVRPGLISRLASWFSHKQPDDRQSLREEYQQHFVDFHQQHPDLMLRVYETAAGFRLMVINKLFDPLSDETEALLKRLNSDRLYRQLCRSQACFRARLTPKPWRCGSKNPPNTYPRQDEQAEQRYLDWLNQYEQKTKDYAVCRLINELGRSGTVEPALAIMRLHDDYVLSTGAQTLA